MLGCSIVISRSIEPAVTEPLKVEAPYATVVLFCHMYHNTVARDWCGVGQVRHVVNVYGVEHSFHVLQPDVPFL